MDSSWAKKLVERVCREISARRAGEVVRPLGMAAALSMASLGLAGCGEADLYGAPDDSSGYDETGGEDENGDGSETELPVDLYGIMPDVTDAEADSETELPVDLYGIMPDVTDADADSETELPVDLYGIMPDTVDDSTETELPVDAYGVPPDAID